MRKASCRSRRSLALPPARRRLRSRQLRLRPALPSCSSSSRSTSSRPTCGTNTARTSPAAWPGSGAGAAFRNGYQSHAATETCPGHSTILTGDHPSRTGIIANVWTDQSVAEDRQERLLRRGRDRAGHELERLQGLARPSPRPDAGRADEGALAGEPQRRRIGQGPRRGDDDRATGRSALVLDRQEVRNRPRRGFRPAGGAEGECGGRGRAGRSRARRSNRLPFAKPRRGCSRSRAGASRSAAAGSRAPPATRPRSAHRPSSTAARSRSPPAWSTRCGSGAGPRPMSSRSACRPPTMSATPTAPKGRRCACSFSISTARSAISSRCSTRAGSIMRSR